MEVPVKEQVRVMQVDPAGFPGGNEVSYEVSGGKVSYHANFVSLSLLHGN